MSRKDTLIIAILINAGLLIILFTSSLKAPSVAERPSEITHIKEPIHYDKKDNSSKLEPAALATPDPLDQVIEQYITPNLPSKETASSETVLPSQPVQNSQFMPTSLRNVIVKKGDVLEKIARQYDVTVTDIIELNQLASTSLKIGQVLQIPATVTPNVSSEDPNYYIVKAGDNPWIIAVKHRMKVEDLLKMNHLNENSAKRLKAGDKIRIR